jgi:ribonucleoside-diphosphate reductase alpha chain
MSKKIDSTWVETKTFDVVLKDMEGNITREKYGVIAPVWFSQKAINVIVANYMHDGDISVIDVYKDVVNTIFDNDKDNVEQFYPNIRQRIFDHMIKQEGMFNSPVLFNFRTGSKRLQGSACFILKREDNMEDILDKTTAEAKIFHGGSGSGSDYSLIREEGAPISGGGVASGPISYMEPCDAWAKSIKSGGRRRRAARYVGLYDDHPDSDEFIDFKVEEDEKARALMNADEKWGKDWYNSPALHTVSGQTANYSMNTSDAFMRKAIGEDPDPMFELLSRAPDNYMQPVKKINAADRLMRIAQNAWKTGDPGLIFRDTVNAANMLRKTHIITGPNPCGEFMGVPDSACNLASLNLIKFFDDDGTFLARTFSSAAHSFIIAMDVIATNAWYPYKEMHDNSVMFRPLGLGYGNLGALLMSLGLPYDSKDGRALAATITRTLTRAAWEASFDLSENIGTHLGLQYEDNAGQVIMNQTGWSLSDLEAIKGSVKLPRNSQVTLLAPTGTIGFAMDFDSTGLEPLLATKQYKMLASGESMVIAPSCVARRMRDVGISISDEELSNRLKSGETITDIVGDKDNPMVYQVALSRDDPSMVISPKGHVDMQAAVQPYLSSAISKTINMPKSSTPEDIRDIYVYAWKKGLKGMTVFRDESKVFQPVTTSEKKNDDDGKHKHSECSCNVHHEPHRVLPPNDLLSLRHKFEIYGATGSVKGYLQIGFYDDGSICEIWTTLSKSGSTINGLLDAFSKQLSRGIQYGAPLADIIEHHRGTKFEPSGFTSNPRIHSCSSPVDYIAQFLSDVSTSPETHLHRLLEIHTSNIFDEDEDDYLECDDVSESTVSDDPIIQSRIETNGVPTGEVCPDCGGIMARQPGMHCAYCANCGKSDACS